MRTRIATRMIEAKQQMPHFYVTSEIDVDALLALRKQINADLDDEHKITVNDLIVKATALTLREFPNLNSHFYGDKIARYKRINIGIAVALPNGGLINVVAKDADKTSLGTMALQNKEMIARARDGKVKPDDMSGSTFTVSNLGAYGVEHFLAIINPPEAGILAVASATESAGRQGGRHARRRQPHEGDDQRRSPRQRRRGRRAVHAALQAADRKPDAAAAVVNRTSNRLMVGTFILDVRKTTL